MSNSKIAVVVLVAIFLSFFVGTAAGLGIVASGLLPINTSSRPADSSAPTASYPTEGPDSIELTAGGVAVNRNTRRPVPTIECGNVDGNSDGIINVTDFSLLASKYGSACRITTYDLTSGCGPLDYNQNGVLDKPDFTALSKKLTAFSEDAKATCNSARYSNCKSIDFNGDKIVNVLDFSSFSTSYKTICRAEPILNAVTDPGNCGSVDVNNDVFLDDIDFNNLKARFGSLDCKTPVVEKEGVACGDLDSDGNRLINISDYSSMATLYLKNCNDTNVVSNSKCGKKDTNLDGVINHKDFDVLAQMFGKTCS